ncbi:MAG: MarR family transcriptional regulator [Alphaproteobacteria bacterium]|nr:MarR family transcriptional regulator [Alphaproteobacteria bacterium]
MGKTAIIDASKEPIDLGAGPAELNRCTAAAVRRAARRVTQVYDEALKPLGLTLPQYSVLANLLLIDGASVTELAAQLVVDRTTLTRNLGPLSRSGWVRLEPGADGRSRAVRLTDTGRLILASAVPAWQGAEVRIRAMLGETLAGDLRAASDQTVAALDREG